MGNDNDKVIQFNKPKGVREQKKLFGTVQVTEDNRVRVDMEDKSMLLEGATAFDFGLLIMCAARVVLTGSTIKIEETE